MKPEFYVDYPALLCAWRGGSLERIAEVIQAEMSHAWLTSYHRMCNGPTNVLAVSLQNSSYLFDFCTELIYTGELPPSGRQDRAVVAYGVARTATRARDASRLRGFPGADKRGDRGSLIAHAASGELDINVFHQDAYLNRGWSPQGRRYREMERYCAENDGTFFFSRLIYEDETATPAEIELGILMPDATLWVEVFQNFGAA